MMSISFYTPDHSDIDKSDLELSHSSSERSLTTVFSLPPDSPVMSRSSIPGISDTNVVIPVLGWPKLAKIIADETDFEAFPAGAVSKDLSLIMA
jgi:hypothetical protein